jgi:hypothetical protein
MAQTGDALGYYYEEDYIEAGYYNYEPYIQDGYVEANYFQEEGTVQEATATLLSAFNANNIATAGIIKSSSATLDGVFSPIIFAVASRNSSIDMAAQTGIAVNNQRTRSSDVTLDNIVNLSLQSARIRDTAMAIAAAFAATSTASRTRSNSSSLAVSFGQTANPTKLVRLNTSLTGNFALTIQTAQNKSTTATVSLGTALTTDVETIKSTTATATATTTLTTDVEIIKSTTATVSLGTTLTTDVEIIKSTTATATSEFSATGIVLRSAGIASEIQQLSTLAASAGVVKSNTIAINSVFIPTLQVFATRSGDVDLVVLTQQTSDANKIASIGSAQIATTTAGVITNRTRNTISSVQLTASTAILNQRTRNNGAVFASTTALGTIEVVDGVGSNSGSTSAGVIKSTSATLAVNSTTTTLPNATRTSSATIEMQSAVGNNTVRITQGSATLAVTTQVGNNANNSIGANGGVIPNFESSSISVDTSIAATATVVKSLSANPTANFNLASDGDTLIQANFASAFGIVIDAQQTFGRPNTWVGYNNSTPAFSTTAKFGSHSLISSIKRNYISSPNSAFAFGEDDFTIEAWVRPNSIGQYGGQVYGADYSLVSGTGYFVNLQVTGDYRLKFNQFVSGGIGTPDTSKVFSLETGANSVTNAAWNHVAVTRAGPTYSLYVNGSRLAQITNSFDTDYPAPSDQVSISGASDLAIDEHRISRFTTRYTGSTYTVPTQQFVNDANTTNLLHLDNDLLDDVGAVAAFLNTTATLTSQGGKLKTADIELFENTTAITATANTTAEGTADLVGFASTLSDAEVIPPVELDSTTLTATSQIAVTGRSFSLQDVRATVSSETTLDATATLKSALNGELDAVSTMVANAGVIKSSGTDLTSTTALTAASVNVEIVTSSIAVTATLTASSRVDYVSPSANLSVDTSIELLFIDTKRYVYQIPNESRKYQIHSESRKFTVDNENRTYIPGEL